MPKPFARSYPIEPEEDHAAGTILYLATSRNDEIMAGRLPKNTVEDWVAAALKTLVDEGIAGVKVDRLASRLGVTRGGFYHHFRDRDQLLDLVLDQWEKTCRFLPETPPPSKPAEAVEWLEMVADRLIEGDGYDYHLDLAVREWARSEKRAEWAIERADRERLDTLRKFFEAIGYDEAHASVRARVFYYHQVGYYAIGVHQSVAERRRSATLYIEILCGEEQLRLARSGKAKARRARAVA